MDCGIHDIVRLFIPLAITFFFHLLTNSPSA